jgi:hypothetical protein
MAAPTAIPYLTIVMSSRNDDHGHNLLLRTQICLSGLLEQLERHRIESELILVDWNPPPDRPPLKDIINWPEKLEYCTIRVITVPKALHDRYEGADKLPMNLIVAFNCAIRRARGKFVLPRAADVLYDEELIAYIAKKDLKINERYRVDRCDVNRDVVTRPTLEEQLQYCRGNIIKINSRQQPAKGLPDLHTNASGDFQLMSRHYWHLLHGYREGDIPAAYADSLMSYASYVAGVREVVLSRPRCIYHIDHENKFTERIEQEKLPLEKYLLFSFMPQRFNRRLKSLYRLILGLAGYKQKSRVQGVPTLDYSEFCKISRQMLSGKRSNVFNGENWGLKGEELEERVIHRAAWDEEIKPNN